MFNTFLLLFLSCDNRAKELKSIFEIEVGKPIQFILFFVYSTVYFLKNKWEGVLWARKVPKQKCQQVIDGPTTVDQTEFL